jgi:plastocyanin
MVRLDGLPPPPQTINMGSEAACEKANAARVVSTVTLGENSALANVVVFVKSGLKPYRFETPTQPAVVDQRGCLYEPRIVAVMANQPIEIRNDDATIHNVHAMPKENPEWNKAQRAGAAALQVRFSRPELAIPLICNVHPWMRAFVFVFASPYYAVTTREGRFTLKNLPPGSYVIEAWQERYGTLGQSVSIGPRESKSVSFAFRADSHPGD